MSQVNVPLAFRNMSDNLRNANPNTGDGYLGPWPAEGEHDCIITDLTFNEKAKYFVKGTKEPIESPSAQFHYQVVGAPGTSGAPEDPMVWKGKPMVFPPVKYSEDDKNFISAKIDRDRFAGFFSVIMGRKFNADTFGDDLLALITKIKGTTPVICRIKAEYRPWTSKPKPGEEAKKGIDKQDFCRELLQGG